MEEDKIIESLFTDYMDRVVNLFWENPESIYPQKVKTKILFDNAKRISRNHKNRRKCLVQGCNCKTIRKSHSISKNLFLESISENSIVISPSFDNSEGRMVLKQKGIGNASTFPGFCEKHEELFLDFEQNGEFKKTNHFNLQLFRTICREYYIKVFRKETFQILLEDYLSNRKESFLKAYKDDPFGRFIESKGNIIKSIEYSGKDEI